jgi:hypothetical protein
LFPALQFLNKEVVSLCDLAELGIHSALQVDEILPCLKSIPGILVPFPNNFVKVTHRNFGHEGFLHCPAKYSLHPGISSLY